MRAITTLILLTGLAGLVGCGPNPDQYGYNGFSMNTFFPFDGSRVWTFANEQESVNYKLVGTLQDAPEIINGGDTRVYTIEFTRDCINQDPPCDESSFAHSWRWSSDPTYGTLLHSYDVGSGTVAFEPPVQVTTAQMKTEDFIETETGGTNWTSTLTEITACPVQWNVEWDECAKFDLDDGDGDPSKGSPVSGTYWAVAGYNIVAFDLPGQPGRWELLDHDYAN